MNLKPAELILPTNFLPLIVSILWIHVNSKLSLSRHKLAFRSDE
jgi:hypothetical protein